MLNFVVEKSVEPVVFQTLKQRFIDLCKRLRVEQEQAIVYWEELAQFYQESHRAYHNLVHIWNFLNLFDEYQNEIKEAALFELAIWYHDAIYNTKNKDNEYQSAQLFQKRFTPYLTAEQLTYIDLLIMSTAGHYPRAAERDVYWFLDFDLAILATSYSVYKEYSEAIWQEYKMSYIKMFYKIGRKKVLKSFLSREKLYFSDTFYQEYEEKARQNIQLELNT